MPSQMSPSSEPESRGLRTAALSSPEGQRAASSSPSTHRPSTLQGPGEVSPAVVFTSSAERPPWTYPPRGSRVTISSLFTTRKNSGTLASISAANSAFPTLGAPNVYRRMRSKSLSLGGSGGSGAPKRPKNQPRSGAGGSDREGSRPPASSSAISVARAPPRLWPVSRTSHPCGEPPTADCMSAFSRRATESRASRLPLCTAGSPSLGFSLSPPCQGVFRIFTSVTTFCRFSVPRNATIRLFVLEFLQSPACVSVSRWVTKPSHS
mmetsp:Transcript_7255/g.19278  ORF Transcript_7255/g.19278 Transcript_7255/m.19278 type:complete len:265 (+) Transcript_7255:124-918(+)